MRITKILQLIILILVFGAIPALSQQTSLNQNSAAETATTALAKNGLSETRITSAPDCEEDLRISQQRLAKTLDNLEKAESLIATLNSEIEARKRLETTNNQIIAAKDNVIEEQKKLISILEKQSQRKLKVLWGLISVRF